MNLNDRLVATKFRPSGFDYMRIVLAVSIIVWHSILISYGAEAQSHALSGFGRVPIALMLPMFFALSGFLVAGSLERTKSLPTFFGLRVLRIVPALACEVTLSALLLGPILTTYTYSQYFSDPLFRNYFLNVLGDIHYRLPGLFATNPFPEIVNGQLWTVPFELICYLALGALGLSGIFARRRILLIALVVVQLGFVALIVIRPHEANAPVTGGTLVAAFLAGVLIYRFRDKIQWSPLLFVSALFISVILLIIPNGDRLIALPSAYLTAYVGLLNPSRVKILFAGDYSYGIYLYGFPLQQAFAFFGPSVHQWYWNVIAVVPASLCLAVLSWWIIEKPALSLRKFLTHFETWQIMNKQVNANLTQLQNRENKNSNNRNPGRSF